MKKVSRKAARAPAAQQDIVLVAQLAAAISIASFFYYLKQQDLLLYGDAVAHINIARRVFDSQTPGPLQLGTVWLPLPHILMMPFIVSRWLWQTGIGASIPSLVAFVFSTTGIFRVVRSALLAMTSTEGTEAEGGRASSPAQMAHSTIRAGAPPLADFPRGGISDNWTVRFCGWLAASIFAFNPNLIYLQTTAMTESVYLAFSIWAVVFFCEAIAHCRGANAERGNSSLVKCGISLCAACLTRYDGWLLAALLVVVSVCLAWIGNFSALRKGAVKLTILAALAPALWLAYNAAVYRNPLEFANGPYSAVAIEAKTAVAGMPPHPGDHNLRVAFQYFSKAAQLNMAEGKWSIFWVAALLFGTAVVVLFQRKLWPLLLLWVPSLFYMLSIAYSGVPLFIPVWWPFSRYNVRYGVEFLPAFAAFTAIGVYGLLRFVASAKAKAVIVTASVILPAISYAVVWRHSPESFQEAVVNSTTRIALETQLANEFEKFPSDTKFLMYLGDHVGAFQQAGIPLSHVINEGNHRPWVRPRDPEGLWERALQHPADYADYVIAFDSDLVASDVNKNELASMEIIRVSGQPQATIYKTVKSNQAR